MVFGMRPPARLLLMLTVLAVPALLRAGQSGLEEPPERIANRDQPPARVMALAGVEPGMVVGEVGAGRGRVTVHLAARVGATGRVYANDIDAEALGYLADRCRKNGLANVETVLGLEDDPRFPRTGLDLILMVWTYHMTSKPAGLLASLGRYAKPGAPIVMVEPAPDRVEAEIARELARTGRTPAGIHVVSRESLEKDAATAGLELVRMTPLGTDNVFVLKARAEGR